MFINIYLLHFKHWVHLIYDDLQFVDSLKQQDQIDQ